MWKLLINQKKLLIFYTYIEDYLYSQAANIDFIEYLDEDEVPSDSLLEDSIGTQAVLLELFHEESQPIYPAYDDYECHDPPFTENLEQDFATLQNVNWPILNEDTPSQSQLINTIKDLKLSFNPTISSVVEICFICNLPIEPMTYCRCSECRKYLQQKNTLATQFK